MNSYYGKSGGHKKNQLTVRYLSTITTTDKRERERGETTNYLQVAEISALEEEKVATFNSRGGVSKFPQPVINYYNQLLVS